MYRCDTSSSTYLLPNSLPVGISINSQHLQHIYIYTYIQTYYTIVSNNRINIIPFTVHININHWSFMYTTHLRLFIYIFQTSWWWERWSRRWWKNAWDNIAHMFEFVSWIRISTYIERIALDYRPGINERFIVHFCDK